MSCGLASNWALKYLTSIYMSGSKLCVFMLLYLLASQNYSRSLLGTYSSLSHRKDFAESLTFTLFPRQVVERALTDKCV